MALALVARAADPQALKALLAAKLGGKAVEFKPSADVAAGPFGTSRVQLQGDGLELTEANAIAELLGAPRAAPRRARLPPRSMTPTCMRWAIQRRRLELPGLPPSPPAAGPGATLAVKSWLEWEQSVVVR